MTELEQLKIRHAALEVENARLLEEQKHFQANLQTFVSLTRSEMIRLKDEIESLRKYIQQIKP